LEFSLKRVNTEVFMSGLVFLNEFNAGDIVALKSSEGNLNPAPKFCGVAVRQIRCLKAGGEWPLRLRPLSLGFERRRDVV
jgi:hypothetical protein